MGVAVVVGVAARTLRLKQTCLHLGGVWQGAGAGWAWSAAAWVVVVMVVVRVWVVRVVVGVGWAVEGRVEEVILLHVGLNDLKKFMSL